MCCQKLIYENSFLFFSIETKPEPIVVNKEDECFEIVPSKEQEECDYFSPNLVSTLSCITFENDQRVYHVSLEDIIDKLIDRFDDIGCAEQNHSDLVSGVYEGLKGLF